MFGHFHAERERAQVCDFAEERDRCFGVACFQFSRGRTHIAERMNPTVRANGLAMAFGLSYFQQFARPSFCETPLADVVAILMRNQANREFALRIDGASPLSAATQVPLLS